MRPNNDPIAYVLKPGPAVLKCEANGLNNEPEQDQRQNQDDNKAGTDRTGELNRGAKKHTRENLRGHPEKGRQNIHRIKSGQSHIGHTGDNRYDRAYRADESREKNALAAVVLAKLDPAFK